MRFALMIAIAAVLLVPIGMATSVGTELSGADQPPASDLSAARKKAKKKAPPKEQYLRAVPSAPPAGSKK
jgi:hypothetical protein